MTEKTERTTWQWALLVMRVFGVIGGLVGAWSFFATMRLLGRM